MCSGNSIHIEIVVPNETRYLSLIGNIAEQVAAALDDYAGDRSALAYHLNLVLTEAMMNAIEHGESDKDGKEREERNIRICIRIEGMNLLIRVYDHGQGFDLNSVPCPDFDQQPYAERGRGIFVIRSLMDCVAYRRTEAGNVLEMHKKLA